MSSCSLPTAITSAQRGWIPPVVPSSLRIIIPLLVTTSSNFILRTKTPLRSGLNVPDIFVYDIGILKFILQYL